MHHWRLGIGVAQRSTQALPRVFSSYAGMVVEFMFDAAGPMDGTFGASLGVPEDPDLLSVSPWVQSLALGT